MSRRNKSTVIRETVIKHCCEKHYGIRKQDTEAVVTTAFRFMAECMDKGLPMEFRDFAVIKHKWINKKCVVNWSDKNNPVWGVVRMRKTSISVPSAYKRTQVLYPPEEVELQIKRDMERVKNSVASHRQTEVIEPTNT
jgi:nucleoid DNA-binding protein